MVSIMVHPKAIKPPPGLIQQWCIHGKKKEHSLQFMTLHTHTVHDSGSLKTSTTLLPTETSSHSVLKNVQGYNHYV